MNRLDCLIVIDRKVDMVTPLLTQLTYEGLIDEALGMKNCKFAFRLIVLSFVHSTKPFVFVWCWL